MEKKIITAYAKHLDLTKVQFDALRQEVKERLKIKPAS
jgi:hypothetical protein